VSIVDRVGLNLMTAIETHVNNQWSTLKIS
jgi:hypothetical protein